MLSITLLLVATLQAGDYPRIANLWGCSPASTDYDKWSRYDLLVTAGGSQGEVGRFKQEIEARNPGALLLGTGALMNIGSPATTPWMKDDWYMRRPDGSLITWWADQIYTPNILSDDCLAALVDQTVESYGGVLSDGSLDGMLYDSVVGYASWLGPVDANRDGKADVPAEVDARWHDAQCAFFDKLRETWPGIRILANDVDEGHRPHVNGRLFEGGPLLDRVANGSLSADGAIRALQGWTAGSEQPAITFAIMTHPVGWQGFRVGRGDKVTTPGELDRVSRDFGRMSLGLLISLMTDAYYAYDLGTVWYGLPFWYAEYDAPLGKALGPARQVEGVPPVTVLAWKAGDPTDGLALDEYTSAGVEGVTGTVTDTAAGWHRLFGTDPRKVGFEPGRSYEVDAVCEIVRQPSGVLQFNLRTAKGGWEHHDKGVETNKGEDGSTWRLRTIVVPDDFDDYAAEWHLSGAGTVRLKSLHVSLVNESYWMREFEGGVALLNRLSAPVKVKLATPMRRLKDDACPLHIIECDDSDAGFEARGAWETVGSEGAFCGTSYHVARKPGEVAAWRVAAPGTDRYTVLACSPKLEGLTDAAEYTVMAGGATVTAILDQRKGDGDWVKLVDVDLREGETFEMTLRSGGAGLTVADAVRLESAGRLNDGARIESVILPPFDGALLLRGE